MLTSIRSLSAASVFALSFVFTAPALAQEEEADGGIGVELSANVALVSEYRFRGVDLSGGDIAIQGGVDAALPAGFYVGTWASSLEEDLGFGHTELDVYGGWTGEFGVVTLDAGVIGYLYPNAPAGDFDYFEGYGSVALGLGPATAEVGVAYAPEQDSLGGTDNLYVYSDLGVGIPDTPVSLSGHLGYTDGFLTFTPDSKAWDWSVGADLAIPNTPLTLGAAYVGAEGSAAAVDDAFVVSLSASF